MASTTARRWNWLKNRFTVFPVLMRRTHRVVSTLWLLSLALTLAVPTAGEALPGPSIPGLSFIALIITGTYLLLRPLIRGERTVVARWKRLTNLRVARPVLIRRTHRIFATLVLLLLGITLALQAGGGSSPQSLIKVAVGLLLVLVLTGLYMLFRPWVARFRGG